MYKEKADKDSSNKCPDMWAIGSGCLRLHLTWDLQSKLPSIKKCGTESFQAVISDTRATGIDMGQTSSRTAEWIAEETPRIRLDQPRPAKAAQTPTRQ
ncbi:hypothetical protein SARC_05131 [Sphaeroforma arctica JP610]|uniref:Uncharacterized protein n=1 Tax=Sphaeroforma arctica JP610 TaxID=667725 RepID=A0A0L0G0K5_9EUKA|nr:hypothetical protein SARC_05131 [Sphaeroforma arctica JP610]KNC82580.1 hypothetical protein SARC_05131 [Sphaeroforma arctica JP610]|eukprot:XP_014156482.1 hypothetical protein SARC_05131 [Sphaeroforma arctica JP610]